MIRVENIRKSFGQLEVLKGIDISIEKGKIVSIVGASGAGKTTLLQILGTLGKPDSGRLLIGDVEPFKLKERALAQFRNQQIGFVFQFHHLLPEFKPLKMFVCPHLLPKHPGGKPKKGPKSCLCF